MRAAVFESADSPDRAGVPDRRGRARSTWPRNASQGRREPYSPVGRDVHRGPLSNPAVEYSVLFVRSVVEKPIEKEDGICISSVGATGPVGLGGEICRLLRSAGKPTRVFVRATSDAGRVDTLRRLGVELTEGDLKDRRSLEVACQGVSMVISTASILISRQSDDTVESVDRREQKGSSMLRGRAVSSLLSTPPSPVTSIGSFRLRNAKRDVEQHLKTSGLSYTILRPTFYMEVWLTPIAGFDFPNARAAIYGEGLNKISWLSFYDVARFAMWCMNDPKARNATFELGGPEALSPREVVRIFENISGRLFEVECVPNRRFPSSKPRARIPGCSPWQAFEGAMPMAT